MARVAASAVGKSQLITLMRPDCQNLRKILKPHSNITDDHYGQIITGLQVRRHYWSDGFESDSEIEWQLLNVNLF